MMTFEERCRKLANAFDYIADYDSGLYDQGVYTFDNVKPTKYHNSTIIDMYKLNGIIYDLDNNIQYFRDNGAWHKWTYKGDY